MAEYHTVYKGPEGETTQWEDIQVKLGNMAPKPKAWKPDAYRPEEAQQIDQQFLDKAHDEQQLEDLQDQFDDDRALEEYRCGFVHFRTISMHSAVDRAASLTSLLMMFCHPGCLPRAGRTGGSLSIDR
jgi:hypothetical protein